MDLFWIFLIIIFIQPYIHRRLLESRRLKLILELQKQRESRVITLIHRQEAMSFLGFPVFRYIDINDSEQIIKAIRTTPEDVPIDLILHTPGGLVLAALQIAYALTRHKARVTVFVPFYAMSGGTFLALAADEIVMGHHAVLGPVDPQIGEYPAVSILKVPEQKDKNKIADRTLIMADVARKALTQIQAQVSCLLRHSIPKDRVRKLTEDLTSGRWTHDYPISYEEARKLGLSVNPDLPQKMFDLLELYPQPVRREPSVEYFPWEKKALKEMGI